MLGKFYEQNYNAGFRICQRHRNRTDRNGHRPKHAHQCSHHRAAGQLIYVLFFHIFVPPIPSSKTVVYLIFLNCQLFFISGLHDFFYYITLQDLVDGNFYFLIHRQYCLNIVPVHRKIRNIFRLLPNPPADLFCIIPGRPPSLHKSRERLFPGGLFLLFIQQQKYHKSGVMQVFYRLFKSLPRLWRIQISLSPK